MDAGSASHSAPQGARSGPPPSCWGSSSKVDGFELAGHTTSRQNRTTSELEGRSACAVGEVKVRWSEQKVPRGCVVGTQSGGR